MHFELPNFSTAFTITLDSILNASMNSISQSVSPMQDMQVKLVNYQIFCSTFTVVS